jgi:hypothetical protein
MYVQLVDGPSTSGIQSRPMATPQNTGETKTLRVSVETHAEVHALADKLKGSADDALQHLLGMSTVRVPLSEQQRDRWIQKATEIGVTLPEFVKLRVEAAIQFGADPGTLHGIYQRVGQILELMRKHT